MCRVRTCPEWALIRFPAIHGRAESHSATGLIQPGDKSPGQAPHGKTIESHLIPDKPFRLRLINSPALFAVCAIAILLLAGCAQKMTVQPKVNPLAASDFFPDGQSARPLPADTVPRDESAYDDLLNTGKVNGQDSTVFPFPITQDILLRGQERFNTFCAVCHDRTGSGNGMIVQNGYASPPDLRADRLVKAPIGHFFDVITNGFSAADQMPSYASQIPVADRWAIAAYVRALQLSQNATIQDVPLDIRPTLEAQP